MSTENEACGTANSPDVFCTCNCAFGDLHAARCAVTRADPNGVRHRHAMAATEPAGQPPDVSELRTALHESVKLQSHYANLLNMHDGGERIGFASADDWIARLRETGTLPAAELGEVGWVCCNVRHGWDRFYCPKCKNMRPSLRGDVA